jgi:peptidoglycan/LPS O-acetylase OafA/YrhL
MRRSDKGHFVGIEITKSIAILSVVATHCGLFPSGRYGVQLFYVVSGFLLSLNPIAKVKTFVFRRFLRLFPLYYFFSVVFYHELDLDFNELLVSLLLLQTLTLKPSEIPGIWSISNEWLFSLLIPFCKTFSRNALLYFVIALWVFQGLIEFFSSMHGNLIFENVTLSDYILKTNPISNSLFFIAGMLFQSFLKTERANSWIFLPIFFVSIVICVKYSELSLFFATFPVITLFYCTYRLEVRNNLIAQIFVHIGTRTYSIYFVHFIVLLQLQKSNFILNLPIQNGVRGLVLFFLTLVISLLVSKFTYQLVERPFLKYFR